MTITLPGHDRSMPTMSKPVAPAQVDGDVHCPDAGVHARRCVRSSGQTLHGGRQIGAGPERCQQAVLGVVEAVTTRS